MGLRVSAGESHYLPTRTMMHHGTGWQIMRFTGGPSQGVPPGASGRGRPGQDLFCRSNPSFGGGGRCGQRKAHMREEQRTVFIIIVLVYAYRERNYHIVCCVCVGQGVIVYFVNMLSSAVVVIQGSSPHVCKGLAPLVLLVCISIANFNSLS